MRGQGFEGSPINYIGIFDKGSRKQGIEGYPTNCIGIFDKRIRKKKEAE